MRVAFTLCGPMTQFPVACHMQDEQDFQDELMERSPTKQDEDGSANHFDKIRQFLAGIEIYPFAGRVQIGQAPVFFALDPYRIHTILNTPVSLGIFHG